MAERLLAALPLGVKVTMVTAPWRPRISTPRTHGGSVAVLRHAVSFLTADPHLPVAFCQTGMPLANGPDEGLTDCPKCASALAKHQVWPL